MVPGKGRPPGPVKLSEICQTFSQQLSPLPPVDVPPMGTEGRVFGPMGTMGGIGAT